MLAWVWGWLRRFAAPCMRPAVPAFERRPVCRWRRSCPPIRSPIQVQDGISKRPGYRSGAQDSDYRLSPEVFIRGSCGPVEFPEDYEQGLQRPTISSECPVATKCRATVADDTISTSAVSDSFDSSMSSIEPQISHLVW